MSFLIGLVAGLFGCLVGLGGGAIMVPLLVRFHKFSQHQALGTTLIAMVFAGLSGSLTYYLNGSLDLGAAILLSAAAIFTARFGALYANALPEWQLKRVFGGFLIFVSLLLLSKPLMSHLALLRHPARGWLKVAILLASGAAAGFISGMTGVGGGAVMVPAMVLLLGFNQYTAQGSALLVMVPAGSMGAYTHWRQGNVVSGVLFGLILGIFVGSFGGGSLAHLLSEANLRLVFAAVLSWLGIRDIRAAARKKLIALAE
jgi:uncharacterized membrane protein YfcA